MWIYFQESGELLLNGKYIGTGYSGAPEARNNPALEAVPNVGPIPTGDYAIGDPEDTLSHGPYVLPLTPNPSNEMYERSGFLIHGDSIKTPGTASHGCIIMQRQVREAVHLSLDTVLRVLPRKEPYQQDAKIPTGG